MLKNLILFITATLGLAACSLDEVEEKCGVVNIDVSYEYTIDGSNMLTDVRGMTFYVFDNTTGLLVQIIDVPAEDIAAGRVDIHTVPDGNYTFVAWAGAQETLPANGFKVVQMDGRTTYEENSVEIGKTTKEEFFLMVDYDNVPEGMRGQITPKGQLHDLYFAIDENVVINHDIDTQASMRFIRNTNVLNVSVDGIQYLSSREGNPLQIYVVGPNGRYDWNNAIADNAREVLYQPYDVTMSSTEMTAMLRVLRFELAKYNNGDQPIMVYVVDPLSTDIDHATGLIKPLRAFDLIKLIQDKVGAENLTQAFLDETYQFNIQLTLNMYLDVDVELVGWGIEIVKPQL